MPTRRRRGEQAERGTPRRQPDSIRYQAEPDLICYWRDGRVVLHHITTAARLVVTDLALALVAFCRTSRTLPEISRAFPQLPPERVQPALDELMSHQLLTATSRTRPARPPRWASWGPSASLFHYATRDVPWASGPALQALEERVGGEATGLPSPVKRVRSSTRIRLSRAPDGGEFSDVLRSRRTWRGFARTPVALETLGHLLDLTFGVRHWATSEHGERVMLRTSPSAGACHPIEAFVVAARVRGLARGTYHYEPDRHRLALVREGASAGQIEAFLGGQWWYRQAAAVVIMTAVLPRVWTRYPYPRAYRSVLLDAGHLCQTFCLTATWLNLAPFCTMALADSRLETHLGVDGVNEVVLYAAGIGSRPAGGHVQWPERPPGKTYLSP